MRIATRLTILATLTLAACGGEKADSGEESAGGSTSNPVSSTTPQTGLPCDVGAILSSSCQGCHSNPPVSAAPMPLVTYADLTAPAKSDPSKTVGQMVVVRIQSMTSPMPPAPNAPLSAANIAVLQSWVDAGMPKGSCGPICTSGAYYQGGDDGSSRMNPGTPCLSCHDGSGEAPLFFAAGTVYPTAHEPDMCNGVNVASASVVLVDANNFTLTLAVNAAGNFYTTQPIALPFAAKVVYSGRERAMVAHQSTGNCNNCHTVSGVSGAPGRIMLP